MMKLRIWRVVVSGVATLSLLVNAVLVVGVVRVRAGLEDALSVARNALASSVQKPIVVDVAVDQPIPIRADVPVDQVFTVPIEFTYPLDTVVKTHVDIPVLGRQEIAVPVETSIPISYTLEVPIQVVVPISVTYRLRADIPVEVAMPTELLDTVDNLFAGFIENLRFSLGESHRGGK